MEMTPPRAQASMTVVALLLFPATSEGVAKMPAPTTIPIVSPMASSMEIEGLGALRSS
jgi:hypothetical protein